MPGVAQASLWQARKRGRVGTAGNSPVKASESERGKQRPGSLMRTRPVHRARTLLVPPSLCSIRKEAHPSVPTLRRAVAVRRRLGQKRRPRPRAPGPEDFCLGRQKYRTRLLTGPALLSRILALGGALPRYAFRLALRRQPIEIPEHGFGLGNAKPH